MSSASLTPAWGWYADPMDAAQLRWWDGANWTQQTTPAATLDAPTSLRPVALAADEGSAGPIAERTLPASVSAELAEAAGVYIPPNSVFKMAEAVDGRAYVSEWSKLAGISDDVALSGVPVQLALTAAPSDGPPIPVSADVFPMLGLASQPDPAEPPAPARQVEQPLAAPVELLFPMAPDDALIPAPTSSGALFPGLVPTAPAQQPAAPEPQYQPHPGEYVPFDPNAVRLEPVPAIPFSSRDPFNPASTSRPDLRSYGAAPIGPIGPTWTGALILIIITPMPIAGGYAALLRLRTIGAGLVPDLSLAGLIVALAFIGIGAAQFDRSALAKRGYFDLASPFWILLTPLAYLAVRSSRLHSQGSGGIRAVFLWLGAAFAAAAILGFSVVVARAD